MNEPDLRWKQRLQNLDKAAANQVLELVHRRYHPLLAALRERLHRFGKSLLLSTIGAYFEARKELFHGLAIEQLEQDWIEYPVLRLGLNAALYNSPEALNGIAEILEAGS